MISIPYSIKDVYDGEKKGLFTVVSTFAGGGGSSTGYRLAGGKILAINEFIPSAVDTYRANYPNTFIFPGDIRELTGNMICRRLRIKPGDLDILDGSPPCASFSMSGKREKAWGKVKKYSDTNQRVDDLFFEFVRILREVRPKVFISENVKGLSIGAAKAILGGVNSGFGLNKSVSILSEFKKAGYKVRWKILNSADYGVPQTRERLIIIGVRDDLGISPSFPKRTVEKWISASSAFRNIDPIIWDEENLSYLTIPGGTYGDWFRKLQPGQSIGDIHPKGHGYNFHRLHKDLPSPTILASRVKSYMHFDELRFISLQECLRIMSFPDDYILHGNFIKKWERLGRAVPPLMMKVVAEHIYNTILSKI